VPFLLIAGPTASGKSALALKLAHRTGAVIVNADSMQVYDGVRVLSARPSLDDERHAEHHLYGHVQPQTEYSTGAYLRDLATLLGWLRAEDRLAILVGGTGLYFKAIIQGLVQAPEVPAEIMSHLNHLAAKGEALHEHLMEKDPAMAARLHPSDLPRIQRALAVFESTGKSLLWWWQERQSEPLIAPGLWKGIALDPPRDLLAERIDQRFIAMIEHGALDEVRFLSGTGLPANRGIMKAHGMPHLVDHLEGRIDLATAIARGQGDTRRYAKRQRTFFQHQLKGFDRVSAFGDAL
jgi:tRNA dimethylallyltransferase